MPGRRLEYGERREIAAGLARGLGYAEIARGLGRPTSTISREVNRCGGPAAYRADRAQVETRRRARRFVDAPVDQGTGAPDATAATGVPDSPGAPGRSGTRSAPGAVTERDIREFEERFGALMIRTGLPKMSARVLACLLTSEHGEMYASELAARLRVSPASISRATDVLDRVALVIRQRDPVRGRARYVLAEDIWHRALRNEADICFEWAASARHGAGLLAGSPAGERLHEMARFLDQMGRGLAAAIGSWQRQSRPRPTTS